MHSIHQNRTENTAAFSCGFPACVAYSPAILWYVIKTFEHFMRLDLIPLGQNKKKKETFPTTSPIAQSLALQSSIETSKSEAGNMKP